MFLLSHDIPGLAKSTLSVLLIKSAISQEFYSRCRQNIHVIVIYKNMRTDRNRLPQNESE